MRVRMCVRSSACMCMRTYARVCRMHSSGCVRAYVRVRARRRERRAAQGGDLQIGNTVDMLQYVCTYARMYTCVRMLAKCISACARACARGGSGRPLCVSLCICTFVCMYVWMYVGIYVCMYECMYRLPLECACVRARVGEGVRAHTRGSSARPLDVHPYVHECMRMNMCIDTYTGAF